MKPSELKIEFGVDGGYVVVRKDRTGVALTKEFQHYVQAEKALRKLCR